MINRGRKSKRNLLQSHFVYQIWNEVIRDAVCVSYLRGSNRMV
jgi:hypothetical protein